MTASNKINNETKVDNTTSRRKFITGTMTGSMVAAGVAIAPGVFLTGPAHSRPGYEAASSKNRWGILVDTNKDVDWNKCVEACNKEHGLGTEKHSREDQKTQYIRVVEIKNKSTGYSKQLPVMCQHCEHPPCVDVCPTGASMKRDDGIVLVDRHRCIGCRYCMMACPYKARSFVHEKLTDQKENTPRGIGTVESCNMCVHLIDQGKQPACVEASNGGMLFGDLNDPNSEISKVSASLNTKQIRADLKLNTAISYQGI
jgi:molybdopterin-containing oxidoreductase family iron-sulfur binding subunit